MHYIFCPSLMARARIGTILVAVESILVIKYCLILWMILSEKILPAGCRRYVFLPQKA